MLDSNLSIVLPAFMGRILSALLPDAALGPTPLCHPEGCQWGRVSPMHQFYSTCSQESRAQQQRMARYLVLAPTTNSASLKTRDLCRSRTPLHVDEDPQSRFSVPLQTLSRISKQQSYPYERRHFRACDSRNHQGLVGPQKHSIFSIFRGESNYRNIT